MKNESKQLTNTATIQSIVDAVNQYMTDVLSEFTDPAVVEITSIKVDIKTGNVYVVYNDYTEDIQKAQELISKALTIQKAINDEKALTSPDETKIAILQGDLSNIDKEFYEVTKKMGAPKRIYEVI